MPLIQIRFNSKLERSTDLLKALTEDLHIIAAKALSCDEGGRLLPNDIMIEFQEAHPLDSACKDLCIRVIANDYPTRRERLDEIRRSMTDHLKSLLPEFSWYVWVMLVTASYGSDTEE